MLHPSRSANAWAKSEIIDSSDLIRRILVSWTGYREEMVPPLLRQGGPTEDGLALDRHHAKFIQVIALPGLPARQWR
jgi:hypothetical protein